MTPLARDPNIFRSYILFTGMDGSDPSLRVGKDAVGIDYRMPAAGGWTKTGTNTDAGFVAYAWDGGALVLRVAYEVGGGVSRGRRDNHHVSVGQDGR